MPPKKKTAPAADAVAIRKRLVSMASELSKLRSACDLCNTSVELATHVNGALVICDVHHEIGCILAGRHREQLITSDEIAQALDAPAADQ